jgi:two-component system OmpR family sensor kinase
LPIRVRLTLAFAVAMAVVLAAMGSFLYLRLGRSLDQTLNGGLTARADDVAALVRQADTGLGEGGGRLVGGEESFAQVLDERGAIVDATPQVAGRALLSGPEVDRARRAAAFFDKEDVQGLPEPVRLLAVPVTAQDRRLVVLVGTALDDRNDALSSLRTQLYLGGPIALLLASLAGYALSAAALRPVESMRRQAEAISAVQAGRRLPVPTARDEVSRLGETLNDMLGRLEEALARERRFVGDASHELRTPLALLRTELELALRRTRSAGELEQAVRSAAEESDRLAQLAEDLLVLARSDQGELPVRRSAVPVPELLAAVAERYRLRAREAGREIGVDSPPGLAVAGDELRLGQALGNLVENALRHGGGAVGLAALERDGAVELHVTDEGPGFPAAFLPRAFERFSRADEARARGGTGLGLAIVEVIARAHGGRVEAANGPEHGADVFLSLPRAEAPR